VTRHGSPSTAIASPKPRATSGSLASAPNLPRDGTQFRKRLEGDHALAGGGRLVADLHPELSAWLEQSCAAQGVPVHVTDPVVLQPVAAILITSERTSAAAAQATAPRHVLGRTVGKTAPHQDHWNDHVAGLLPRRLNGLTEAQIARLYERRVGSAACATGRAEPNARSCGSGRSSPPVSPVVVTGSAELGPV
jgi:hypothetical protein